MIPRTSINTLSRRCLIKQAQLRADQDGIERVIVAFDEERELFTSDVEPGYTLRICTADYLDSDAFVAASGKTQHLNWPQHGSSKGRVCV